MVMARVRSRVKSVSTLQSPAYVQSVNSLFAKATQPEISQGVKKYTLPVWEGIDESKDIGSGNP
jgi:hypothetical protein